MHEEATHQLLSLRGRQVSSQPHPCQLNILAIKACFDWCRWQQPRELGPPDGPAELGPADSFSVQARDLHSHDFQFRDMIRQWFFAAKVLINFACKRKVIA